MPQHVQRSARLKLVTHPVQQRVGRVHAVVLGDRLPGLGLGLLHPLQQIRRKQRPRPVIIGRVRTRVQPTLARQTRTKQPRRTRAQHDDVMRGH